MYKFLAIRIPDGELPLDAVNVRYREKVKDAYYNLYGEYPECKAV